MVTDQRCIVRSSSDYLVDCRRQVVLRRFNVRKKYARGERILLSKQTSCVVRALVVVYESMGRINIASMLSLQLKVFTNREIHFRSESVNPAIQKCPCAMRVAKSRVLISYPSKTPVKAARVKSSRSGKANAGDISTRPNNDNRNYKIRKQDKATPKKLHDLTYQTYPNNNKHTRKCPPQLLMAPPPPPLQQQTMLVTRPVSSARLSAPQ